jgi:dihydroxy-acid dehydratase
MMWRSKDILKRPESSMHRALFKSMGYSDYDLSKPLIGVANSWNRVVPGHYSLRLVSDYVKQGITQAGGTPVEFGVIGACDGIAQGHAGMHFILPSRELIANDVETMVEAHRLDAVVLLGSCDKIVPGMLMAASRLDIPAILVAGGPMEGGCEFDGRAADTTSLTEGLAMLQAGRIDRATYDRLEDCASPTCGSCSFLGTANTMCCLAEAVGMSLPGSATIPATRADRLRAAQASGRHIVEMVRQSIVASDIISREALENAIRLNAAIGGSTWPWPTRPVSI